LKKYYTTKTELRHPINQTKKSLHMFKVSLEHCPVNEGKRLWD